MFFSTVKSLTLSSQLGFYALSHTGLYFSFKIKIFARACKKILPFTLKGLKEMPAVKLSCRPFEFLEFIYF